MAYHGFTNRKVIDLGLIKRLKDMASIGWANGTRTCLGVMDTCQAS